MLRASSSPLLRLAASVGGKKTLLARACGAPLASSFSTYNARINSEGTIIRKSDNLKKQTPYTELLFGHTFTDHMLEVDWKKDEGWQTPVISEFKNFSMSPACVALHYALQCFEGMKAYKDKQGRVRLFRPEKNMARLNASMRRLSMPPLDEKGYLECIKQVGELTHLQAVRLIFSLVYFGRLLLILVMLISVCVCGMDVCSW